MNTFRKITALLVAASLVSILVAFAAVPAGATGAGTTLNATVTFAPHWTRTFRWTIDKSVTPDTWILFLGDSGTSRYTITVTKDSGTDEAWVDGQVCVTNGGAFATQNLAIVAELRNGQPPPKDLIATANVDVSDNPVLGPGETGCYPYRVNIPAAYVYAGGLYKVTANVTIMNHSGSLGVPFGPSPSASGYFPLSKTLINDTIYVNDTNGRSWMFSRSDSVSYDMTFTCGGDAGTHDNTATIQETGQSDGASVTVNCYALEVIKDAHTSFTRTYSWMIDKWADQSKLTPAIGQQFLVNYSVAIGATYTDSDWAVSGNISVHNPAPITATINSVSDGVSPDIAATVDCGVNFPYSLTAGGTLNCTYSAGLPDASSRTNTATTTLQNYDYDYQMNPALDGTTGFSGTASVDFSTATINHVDECIDVSDTYAGALGTVCYADAPQTFSYSRYIGPYDTCGDYTVENTASFVTNDSSTTGFDSWTVTVQVPCPSGCTLTQGYWKTHSKYGPAPYDDNWALIGEDTLFFLSNQSWYQVLWTPASGGNPYYILAHQYIAAILNILNGAARPPEVDEALSWATTFFETYRPSTMTLSKAVRAQAISYANLLDRYNKGDIGPGYCSE